jgi:membrane-bound metal-dependent hydrolase YbcI (DUF457 family)
MLMRTHVAIALFFVLLFIPHVSNGFVFLGVALVSTLLPDIDSGFSKIGKAKSLKFLQFFAGHRKIFHSFTFLITATIFFVLFIPIIALPFFLGYSAHLLADSFTIQGISPFYPLKKEYKGRIRTGGKSEILVFVSFLLLDLFLLLVRLFSIF